jgi:8-hydroxy-5-deazaflavin:NADPH oxidoreductase
MKMGVLGSGSVGQAISAKLIELGHDVMIGTRTAGKLSGWQKSNGGKGRIGSFSETAAHGEILFNATRGSASLDALKMAGAANLEGKILVDISNPLGFSKGMPPSLTICNTDSLGEQIQRAFPAVKVVKTLNTVTATIMVNPRQVAGGDHHAFVSGNDTQAKGQVTEILKSFGWIHILDLGDITTARGVEMYQLLWYHLLDASGTGIFNIKVMK